MREAAFDGRSQLLWRKAQDLAVELTRLVRSMPRDPAADAIANQVMRSSGSIAANIAEGFGRYSQAAYRNHLFIARGSAVETLSWLDLQARDDYISRQVADLLVDQCLELQRLLTLRMKSLNDGRTYAAKEGKKSHEVD